MCQFDESYEESGASPPPTRSSAPEPGPERAPSPGAVQQLVNATAPQTPHQCFDETVDAVKAGAQMLAAGVGVVTSAPTLVGLLATSAVYLASSAAFGASLAKLENCEDEAASSAKAQ